MNSKAEVKRLLKESGNEHLFTDDNYNLATTITNMVARKDYRLKQHFYNIEGQREQYKHDLIVKNCKS